MTKEKPLSEKKVNPYTDGSYDAYILVTDVALAVKRLKEEVMFFTSKLQEIINEIFGSFDE